MSQPVGPRWRFLAICTVISIYFHVGMEWLFFVTKPSFMSVLGFKQQLVILALSPLPLVVVGLAVFSPLWALGLAMGREGRPRIWRPAWLTVARLIPAAVLAVAILLLIDNFTYTVWGFGVKTAAQPWFLGYGFLLLVIAATVFRQLRCWEKRIAPRVVSWKILATVLALPALSILAAFLWGASVRRAVAPKTQVLPSARCRAWKDRPTSC